MITGKITPGLEALEKLQDFIKVNRLRAHAKIPCENDLCKMWNVSRSTLRQATNELIKEGILYRIKDKGIYVSEPKYKRDMMGVDAMVKDLVNQGNKVGKTIISINEIEASKPISKKMMIRLGTKVFEVYRIRNINNVPCTIETTYIISEKYPDFVEKYKRIQSMDKVFTEEYKIIQTTGKEHISIAYASEEEAKLLKIEENSPLFFCSGIALDQNKEIVMYYKQLIRPDKFRFVSTVESKG